MRRALALVPVAALLLTGCTNGQRVCDELGKPSQVEQEATRGGAEVEREIKDVECVVVGDRWIDSSDEE